MNTYHEYTSPFTARYTSQEMSYLFSAQFKISTFRKLWTSLAKAQSKLGLHITQKQIDELEEKIDEIDFEKAHEYEKEFRHDVMAHIHTYGDQCPNAKGIIHLGATSSYVTDNTDLIQLKKALELIHQKLNFVLNKLAKFAEQEKNSACVGYTHFQPAQPTTMGKRVCLWLQDFLQDAKEIERHIQTLPFLGAKGATGTAASFLALFDGDSKKVLKLEKLIAKDFDFTQIIPIAGQTYSRKIDLNILNTLESFAASCHKMATDIRLLSHEQELMEAPTKSQVGSSAMPYKKNPIYSERICGLSRFVISLSQNLSYTTATQWLERSLDDSSNRRLSIPESFLAIDAILNLLGHLISHLQVDQTLCLKNIEKHMAHLAQENFLMNEVKKGKSRQEIHEELRQKRDFPVNLEANVVSLIGRADEQVEEFLKSTVFPYLENQTLKEPATINL